MSQLYQHCGVEKPSDCPFWLLCLGPPPAPVLLDTKA